MILIEKSCMQLCFQILCPICEKNFIQDARTLVHPIDFARCDLTNAYVISIPFKAKKVQFLGFSPYQKELHFDQRSVQLLFPLSIQE